jgi:hypothetical protein
MVRRRSTLVKLLTYDPKIEGSIPTAAGTKRDKIARKSMFRDFPVLVAH